MTTNPPEPHTDTTPALYATCVRDVLSVRTQVERDIRFFKAQIMVLKTRPSPNPIVLQTYQQMLTRRLTVLHWLQDKTRTGGLTSDTRLPS